MPSTDTAVLRRKIFAGCRELGIDDETRHDLQIVETGKDSLSAMTADEMRRVLKALEARGFKARGARRHPRAPRADLRYLHVLWRRLGEAGQLKRPGRDGLNAFIRARFGATWGSVPADVDMLREAALINDVIRALQDMMRRAGLEPEEELS